MAHVIVLSALKGGVGKSTLAANLGVALHRAGRRVLLVDADPQGTLRIWATHGASHDYDGPPVVSMDAKSLRRDLPSVSASYDYVVVDSPPRLGAESRAAMLVADLVLLPVVPGPADAWALQETLGVLDEAMQLRPEILGCIVRNRTDRTRLAELGRRAVASFGVGTSDGEIEVLEEHVGARVAFGEATLCGRGVVDDAPSSEAAYEVRALARAIVRRLGRMEDAQAIRGSREGISAARSHGGAGREGRQVRGQARAARGE